MKLFLNNWVRIAKIVTVVWVINGMWQTFRPTLSTVRLFGEGPMWLLALFYFLSAVLILYLLREYE